MESTEFGPSSQPFQFGQLLASNDKVTRDKAVKSLTRHLKRSPHIDELEAKVAALRRRGADVPDFDRLLAATRGLRQAQDEDPRLRETAARQREAARRAEAARALREARLGRLRAGVGAARTADELIDVARRDVEALERLAGAAEAARRAPAAAAARRGGAAELQRRVGHLEARVEELRARCRDACEARGDATLRSFRATAQIVARRLAEKSAAVDGLEATALDLHPQAGNARVHQCDFLALEVGPAGSAPVIEPHAEFAAGSLRRLPAASYDAVALSLVLSLALSDSSAEVSVFLEELSSAASDPFSVSVSLSCDCGQTKCNCLKVCECKLPAEVSGAQVRAGGAGPPLAAARPRRHKGNAAARGAGAAGGGALQGSWQHEAGAGRTRRFASRSRLSRRGPCSKR